MEAISKSGRKLHGKIAEILVRKGSATPIEETGELEQEVKQVENTGVLEPKSSEETTIAVDQSDAFTVSNTNGAADQEAELLKKQEEEQKESVRLAAEANKLDLIKAGQKFKSKAGKKTPKMVNAPKKAAIKKAGKAKK